MATSEQRRAWELLDIVIDNIKKRTHPPEEWQQFMDAVTKREVYVRAVNQPGSILLEDDVNQVQALLDNRTQLLKPQILEDLKYVGCTLSDPYTRVPIRISEVQAASKNYWETLDHLVSQVKRANDTANQYQETLKKIVQEALNYRSVSPVKDFYAGLVKIIRDMVRVCESKVDFNHFQTSITVRYEALQNNLDQAGGVEDKGNHKGQGEMLIAQLKEDLTLLQQNAPQVLSYANARAEVKYPENTQFFQPITSHGAQSTDKIEEPTSEGTPSMRRS